MPNTTIPISKHPPDPGEFSLPYFDHVLAEYELLNTDGNIPPKVKKIIEDHENGCEPKAADLYLLEKYVICKQPETIVRARLSSLRRSYREIVGSDAYEEYRKSGQTSQPNSSLAEVRADAGRLLDALHWAYAMVPECEKRRTDILRKIVLEMALSGVIALGILFAAFYTGQTLVTGIVLVMLMGALGGFLSVQLRIAKISTEQDPILTMFQLQKGLFAVRLAPLTGALCALVLFLIFQAGLLTGALFPEMDKLLFRLGKIQVPSGEFITGAIATQFAKLLVWCFIAGFAERFVPDTLNKLLSRQEQPTTGKVELAPAATQKVNPDRQETGKNNGAAVAVGQVEQDSTGAENRKAEGQEQIVLDKAARGDVLNVQAERLVVENSKIKIAPASGQGSTERSTDESANADKQKELEKKAS